MNKFLEAFLIVLFCVVLSFGQKGYADLEFGMSPEQVKQKGYVLNLLENDNDGFITYNSNKGVSYPVVFRDFAFFDNKLMLVFLSCDISDTKAKQAIIEGLKEKYGAKFVKAKENSYFYTVNEHLQIEVIEKKCDGTPCVLVYFRGLKIQALYDEAQKKKYQKNLGF